MESDYEDIKKRFYSNLKEDKFLNQNYRYKLSDGSIEWIHLTVTKIKEEDGCPIFYCIAVKSSDETELYRNIVDNSSNGVFVLEASSRNIIYINNIAKEICGFEKSGIYVGENILSLIAQKGKNITLSEEQLHLLTSDKFTEFHTKMKHRYFCIKAKSFEWNKAKAFLIYVVDETEEKQKMVQLQEVIEHIPGGIGIYEIYDGIAHQVYANEGFYILVKDKRENRDENDLGFINKIHNEDIHLIHNVITRLSAGSNEESVDYRTKTGVGGYVWLHLCAKVYKRVKSKITVYISFTDISENMKSKLELTRVKTVIEHQYNQERSRRELLEKGSLYNGIGNLTTKVITEFNNNTLIQKNIHIGMSLKDASEELFLKKIVPEYKEQMLRFLNPDEYFKDPKAEDNNEYTIEYQIRKTNGHLCWIRLKCRFLLDKESGDRLGFFYCYDIDEEKRLQLVQKYINDESVEFTILLNAYTGIIRFAQMKKNVSVYQNFKDGIPIEKLLNEDNLFLMNEDNKKQLKQFFSKEYIVSELKNKKYVFITVWETYPDGKKCRKDIKALYRDEAHEDIIISCRDTTDFFFEEQRQKNALEKLAIEANQSKSEFLSRMSHDMRTPMNGILGLTKLAKDLNTVSALKEYMSQINESGEYLLSLINDVLDFQSIESGKIKLNPQKIIATSVFDSMISMVRTQANEKGVELTVVNHNADMNLYSIFDPIRVKQIFINLISNAIKFTPKGGKVILEVKNISREGNISHNCFKVIDTGKGMSQDFIKNHIFKPFEQEKDDITTEYTGTGLGLAIVYNLVKMMGGRIEVESVLGMGTTFTVYIDFERVDSEEVNTEIKEYSDKVEIEKLKGKNILLVEDNNLNAKIATMLLEKVGCRVIWAKNGQEGIDMFQATTENELDAIFMDIKMPVMDGLTSTKIIRKLDRKDAATIPILAMTANTFDEDIQQTKAVGMNAHLGKPIDVNLMYYELMRCLNLL